MLEFSTLGEDRDEQGTSFQAPGEKESLPPEEPPEEEGAGNLGRVQRSCQDMQGENKKDKSQA